MVRIAKVKFNSGGKLYDYLMKKWLNFFLVFAKITLVLIEK